MTSYPSIFGKSEKPSEMPDILEIQLSDAIVKQRKNRKSFPHFTILSDANGKRKRPPSLAFPSSFRFSDWLRLLPVYLCLEKPKAMPKVNAHTSLTGTSDTQEHILEMNKQGFSLIHVFIDRTIDFWEFFWEKEI